MRQELRTTDEKPARFFEGAIGKAEKLAETALDVERLKVAATHAVEDKVTDAKRMIKKGRYAAEDLVDDTAYKIKREPFRAVGITFGVGFGLGILAGALITDGHQKRMWKRRLRSKRLEQITGEES